MLAVESPGKVLRPPEQESLTILKKPGYRAGQADIKLVVEPAGGIEGKICWRTQTTSRCPRRD